MHAKKLTLLVLLLITGCSSVPSVLYKIDVQQGNIITQEMIDKLKPSMTKSQVRFVLGTPLIDDVFHKDRWDYVYRLVQHGNLVEEYKLTVFFEDDRLVRTVGDFSDSLASISPKLIEPAKYPTRKEKSTKLIPESIISGEEQREESSLETTASGEQDAPTIIAIEDDTIPVQYQDAPDIIAIEDDTIPVQYQDAPDIELGMPPPPPGISDGIEAD